MRLSPNGTSPTRRTLLTNKFYLVIPLCAAVYLAACAHQRSVLPDVRDVKVGREAAGENCKEIGVLNGRTATAQGTPAQALEDLKKEAAARGANYVVIKQYSVYGTGVSGVGYECP